MSSAQQNLFELHPPAWERDDADQQLVASIVFPTGPDKTFDYLVPDALQRHRGLRPARPGPVRQGNRATIGFCVALETQSLARPATQAARRSGR